jgi:hypothetical protein
MRTTVTLDDAQSEYVDDLRESADASDAQAVRNAINRAMELDEELDELREELETVRAEKETLLERRDRLNRIEQRMATSDEIERYENSGVLSWIRNRLR